MTVTPFYGNGFQFNEKAMRDNYISIIRVMNKSHCKPTRKGPRITLENWLFLGTTVMYANGQISKTEVVT